MDLDVDPGVALYGVGVALAVVALLYFLRDVVFGLSITVKAALLLFGAVAFFAVGLATERDLLDGVAVVLGALTGVTFLGYVIVRYDPGPTVTFFVLALAAGAFVALGFLLRERELSLSWREARLLVAGLAVLGLLLAGADVAAGGVSYETTLNDSVTVEPATGETRHPATVQRSIGQVVVSNGPVFRRPVDPPRFAACVLGTDHDGPPTVAVSLDAAEGDAVPDALGGGGRAVLSMEVRLPIPANATEARTYAVERRDACPDAADTPTVAVWTEERPTFD